MSGLGMMRHYVLCVTFVKDDEGNVKHYVPSVFWTTPDRELFYIYCYQGRDMSLL